MNVRQAARALVVDDSRVARAMIARALNGIYAVTEAENAEAGLAALANLGPFALLVVDWNMPGMTGVDFVRVLRTSGTYPELKILMITTEVEATAMIAAVDAGVDEYLMKPFYPEAVLEKLALLDLPYEELGT